MIRKSKKSKGFTLIELLIVVAIVGILAALLIPSAMSAMQKARQTGTRKDLHTISTCLESFKVDRGVAPAWDGSAYSRTSSVYTDLVPFYIKGMPSTDQWGNNILINSGSSWSAAWLGMTPRSEASDFAVGSSGRNATYTFDHSTTGAFYYVVDSMDDFDNDLVIWNGSWVCAPRTPASGS